MKKFKSIANSLRIAASAVWQVIVTFYQFGDVALRVIWDAKVNFPLVLIVLMFVQNTYYSFYRYSKKEYDTGRVTAYNIGYQEGIETVMNAPIELDTALVYDKPNGNVIDTILINK